MNTGRLVRCVTRRKGGSVGAATQVEALLRARGLGAPHTTNEVDRFMAVLMVHLRKSERDSNANKTENMEIEPDIRTGTMKTWIWKKHSYHTDANIHHSPTR